MNNIASLYTNTPEMWRFYKMVSDPLWDTYSNRLYPITMRDALMWAVWLRTRHGDFAAAIDRAVAYFLNGVELGGDIEDSDSRAHFEDQLTDQHQILTTLREVGLDLQFYGNTFSTAMLPIIRTLKCPRCSNSRYLRNLVRGKDYDFTNGNFVTTCPSCKYNGNFDYVDYVDIARRKPLNVINWNPLNIDIDYCHATGTEKITYTPGRADKAFLENTAQSVALETMPRLLLNAMVQNSAILFNGESCIHLAAPADSVNQTTQKGWGAPRFLSSFKWIIMLMLLECQSEAAVKDYMLPIRLLFPDMQRMLPTGSDPAAGNASALNISRYRNVIETVLRHQALNRSSWEFVPAPVQSLVLGGDGKAIVPVDIQQFVKEQLLDTQQVPIEFYRSSIAAMRGDTPSLKMFEQTWEREVTNMDLFFNWYLRRCNELLGWPLMTGKLVRQSIAYDPTRLQAIQFLYDRGEISRATFLRSLRINPRTERAQIVTEAIESAKMQQTIEDRLNKMGLMQYAQRMETEDALNNAMQSGQAQQGGDPNAQGAAPGGVIPPGMSPQAAGGDPMAVIDSLASVKTPGSVTPEQVQADAEQVANILLTTPLGSPRNQIFEYVKQINPTLYASAKTALEQLENQGRQQGVEMQRQGGM